MSRACFIELSYNELDLTNNSACTSLSILLIINYGSSENLQVIMRPSSIQTRGRLSITCILSVIKWQRDHARYQLNWQNESDHTLYMFFMSAWGQIKKLSS